MSNSKINIFKAVFKADSFKEVYDATPDKLKDQVEDQAYDYYTDKIGKLIQSFNQKDTAFIVNVLRCTLTAMECHSPEEYRLAYQMMPEDMLQVIKYAVQEEAYGSKN